MFEGAVCYMYMDRMYSVRMCTLYIDRDEVRGVGQVRTRPPARGVLSVYEQALVLL